MGFTQTKAVTFAAHCLSLLIVPAANCQIPHEPSFQVPQVPPANLTAIRLNLDRSVRNGKFPSFAVCVVQNGQPVWDEAFGWADRERKIKATCDSLYPVASVSKAITATGVFILAERGDIRLDGSVQ